MKKICIGVLFLVLSNISFAQGIKKVSLKELKKMIDTSTTPMVFNFWASWCGPCVREIPWFEKTMEAYKKDNVQLVLISLDFAEDYPKRLEEFVKKHGYTSTVIWLNETDANVFCPAIDASWQGNIPVTLMINNKKKYRKFFAEQLPEKKLKSEVKKLIE